MYYWGPEDASIHFCEKKYNQVWWAAEFFNTLSSVFYIIVGALFLGSHLDHLGKAVMGVGIGSWVLHMTLRYYGQWIDEIAMLVLCFLSAKQVKKTLSNYLLVPIIYIYSLLHQYFAYFFVIFTLALIYIIYHSFKQARKIKRVFLLGYILFFTIGIGCWMADQMLCERVQSFQLHAWWHFSTALATMFGLLAIY